MDNSQEFVEAAKKGKERTDETYKIIDRDCPLCSQFLSQRLTGENEGKIKCTNLTEELNYF